MECKCGAIMDFNGIVSPLGNYKCPACNAYKDIDPETDKLTMLRCMKEAE